MDFLRYGLREGLIPWFFLMSWHHNPFTQHFNRQEVMRSSSWKNAFEYLTWNVFKKCAQEFLKTHPFGFFKLTVLFCGLLPTWPGFLQLQFITQFSQHPLGEVIIAAERKTKILTPGPQKGWVTEFPLESVFPESQPCAHYWFVSCRKYLYHYWQVLISTK